MPSVDLVYDLTCPNVKLARANLMRAFSAAGVAARWQEHQIGDPDAAARVRGFGSPTVLVDGRDVAQMAPGPESCCRIYASGDGTAGAPSVTDIAAALAAAMPLDPSAIERVPPGRAPASRWKVTAAALPGLGIALLPKVGCPLCWPAYAGVLSAMGLTFLMDDSWLFPLMALFLLAALAALTWRAKARHGYGPAVIGAVATVALLAGRFGLDSDVVVYIGAAALLAASTWNAWPRRAAAASCAACVPTKS